MTEGFWREVPCGHPPDPVAALSLDDDPVPVCHCGWILAVDEAISDGERQGAPGPIVPCGKCGCYVAVPLGAPALPYGSRALDAGNTEGP